MESQLGIVQSTQTDLAADELAAVEKLQRSYHDMKAELGKVIVGQEAVIEELLIAANAPCAGKAVKAIAWPPDSLLVTLRISVRSAASSILLLFRWK